MSSKKRDAAHRNTVEQLVGSLPSPDDSWAQVELYRWQHGELPPQDGSCKPLDVTAALEGMARAFDKPASPENRWPAPFNVAVVLRYAAKALRSANAAGEVRRNAVTSTGLLGILDSERRTI